MREILRAIGPGILFAGAAIGVSHLIQSTRAGAGFGFSLAFVVLLAHALKYPAMSFGPRYTVATGVSLLEGYRRQGRWALILFGVLTLGTMFTVQAAVTLVTVLVIQVGLLAPMGIEIPLWAGAAGLLALCAVLLGVGGFGWLDTLIKILMVVMAITTAVASVTVLTKLGSPGFDGPLFAPLTVGSMGMILALAGWMPAPLDISAWNSLWTLEKWRQTGSRPTRAHARLDFNLGFGLCVVLALGFLTLGAVVVYAAGATPAGSNGAFVTQVIDLYVVALGEWVRPVIVAGATAVMFSTTLTVLDALPRSCLIIVDRFRTPETPATERLPDPQAGRPGYWLWLAVIGGGAVLIVALFISSLKTLVDLATTLAFLTTPAIAWLNHRAMFSPDVEAAHRPGRAMGVLSLACVWVFGLVSAGYLYWQFIRDAGT